jgi:hypothetical protein
VADELGVASAAPQDSDSAAEDPSR